MNKAKIIFFTDAYRRAIGEQPSGIGSWAFSISRNAYKHLEDSGVKIPNVTVDRNLGTPIIFIYGGTRSLAEAKAMVRLLFDAAQIGGEWSVEVAP
jgi:hypothetical protein